LYQHPARAVKHRPDSAEVSPEKLSIKKILKTIHHDVVDLDDNNYHEVQEREVKRSVLGRAGSQKMDFPLTTRRSEEPRNMYLYASNLGKQVPLHMQTQPKKKKHMEMF